MNNNTRDTVLVQQIDAYIKGTLSEQEVEELWVELLKKPEYIDYLETEIAVKRVFDDRASEGNRRSFAPLSAFKKSWRWVATAASVVILVIVISLLKDDSDQGIQQLVLSDINIAENLSTHDVLRNREPVLSDADSLLNIGFRAALSGNFQMASTVYREIIENHAQDPAAAQAYLNIGIIRYNSGSYDAAAEAFRNTLDKTVNDPLLKEKAYWYLGNAYIRLARLQDAREAIYETYRLDGMHAEQALRMLRNMDRVRDNESPSSSAESFDREIEEEK